MYIIPQTITIPSTADVGTSFYGACVILVDFHCASAELVVTAAPVPDLVPASPAAPVFNKLTYAANETVTVSIKVRNGGGADSTDGVARLFREAGDEDVQIGEPIALGTIPAGDTMSFTTIFVTAELFGVHQQEYYFAIDTVSDEANSSNNNSGPGLIIVSQENLIDVDGDKLIDIHNLDMLNNIRYNLAGTSYKTSDADTGNACGEMAMTDCIGYELMRDLDFTKSSSYENNNGKLEWLPNRYDPSKATNAGWDPIGSEEFFQGRYGYDFGTQGAPGYVLSGIGVDGRVWVNGGTAILPDKAFSAIFEGNSYSISNLYARSAYDSGLFDVVTGTVRNLTVVNGNVYGGDGANKIGIIAGTVFEGLIINCAARGGGAHGGDTTNADAVGGLVGALLGGQVAASYSTATSWANSGIRSRVGGLVGASMSGTIVASYSAGTTRSGSGEDSKVGGLVGHILRLGRNNEPSVVIASYATSNVHSGTGWGKSVGGLTGDIEGSRLGICRQSPVIASYTTSNVNGGNWLDEYGRFTGLFDSRFCISPINSYSFGVAMTHSNPLYRFSDGTTLGLANAPTRISNPKPNGVIRAGDLTANNVGASWNSASSRTAGAWAFDASYGAPALKYADYDGDGGVDYCAHFPTGACSSNRLLPNQPVFDQGGSRQSAYVIDTQFYPGVGVTIPAKITRGDTDYFQITVEEAGLLTIGSYSDINTQATLYTSDGTPLEYDDNDGAGNNFKISRAISRGVFYIRANGYSNQVGSYTLDIVLSEIK